MRDPGTSLSFLFCSVYLCFCCHVSQTTTCCNEKMEFREIFRFLNYCESCKSQCARLRRKFELGAKKPAKLSSILLFALCPLCTQDSINSPLCCIYLCVFLFICLFVCVLLVEMAVNLADWEDSKENVLPLRGGRDPVMLSEAFKEPNKRDQKLIAEKQ